LFSLSRPVNSLFPRKSVIGATKENSHNYP
jgi:hypothetical protein